jgi:hypothetical protein
MRDDSANANVAHAQARWLGWLRENEHGWEVMEWRERVNSKQ